MRLLILGGGALGRLIAEAVKGEFDVTIIEKNELRAKALEEVGLNVVQGDFSYTASLVKAGIDRADLIVITTRDLETMKKTLYVIRSNNKDVPVVVVLPDDTSPNEFMEQIREEFETDIKVDYVVTPLTALKKMLVDIIMSVGEKKNVNLLIKKLKELSKTADAIGIIMHDNPDPDSIASAMALSLIAQSLGFKTKIFHGGEITHHENRAFVNLLGVELTKVSPGSYELRRVPFFALVDCQPNGNLTILGEEDYEKIKIVIDHHQVLQHLEEVIPSDAFIDIRPDVGASSSILAEYLRGMGYPLTPQLATALFYGIYIDTKKFSKLSPVDLKAIEFLAGNVDYEILDKIEHPDISTETAEILARAILNRRMYKNIVISNVGFIDNRDALAEAADFLLRLEGITTVLVFGIVDDYIEMSARTRDVRVNIGAVMKEAFGDIGSGGGHATAGGARVSLGLFKKAKDKNSLLRLVEEAITENFLEAMNVKER
jgi:nanoRNase/pAp phosphatase (c-di-AMP/oligoRNAs hydrolase)/Trk K+ transport system NAD-binding subunit